jgi:amidohydrolase
MIGMKPEDLKQRAAAEIEVEEPRLIDLSKAIQADPEPGYEEFEASGRLTDALEERGFVVERGVAGLPTAFSATLGTDDASPTVAFLAEYDALPEIGHGCGHNLIAAGTLGGAVGLQAVIDQLSGRLVVLGTPAEEFTSRLHVPGTPPDERAVGGGKVKLLEAGLLDDVDVCLMFHPSTQNKLVESNLAFAVVELAFKGQPAHAAADPWNGVNALDGVLLTYIGINALRQHVKADVRIHGIITEGGAAANIVPERAAARFMVRAADRAGVEEVLKRVIACARGAALASGAELDADHLITIDNIRVNQALQQIVADNFVAFGAEAPKPVAGYGSTDFGNVSQYRPGVHFYVATHPPDISWHSAAVAKGSVSDQAHAGMLLGSKVLAATAIDLLSSGELLETVERGFRSS